MIGNSNIRTLQSQKAALQGTYQQKLQTFKPDYPEMLPLKSQIDELDRQIAQEIGGVRASVRAEYNAAATQERMLIGQISSLRSQALDVDGRSIQYNILKRETDTNRQIYDSLLQRFKEVGVAGGDTSSLALRALGAWGLSWQGQLAPGVALTRLHADNHALQGLEILLKGGQMGPPDIFTRLLLGGG